MATPNLPYSATGYAQTSAGLYYSPSNPGVFYNASGQVVSSTASSSTNPTNSTNSNSSNTTSNTQNTSLNQGLINQLRAQIQNGQLTPQDALSQYKVSIGYSANASLPSAWQSQISGALFSNLGTIKTPDGQYGNVNSDGSVTQTSTKVVSTNTTSNGTTSATSAQGGNQNIQPPTVALQPGATGTAVKQLQDYLVSQGVMTQVQVNTGYGTYGPQTTAAVQALQQKLGVNNTSGPGYYGPQTISAVTNSNSGSSNSSSSNSGNSNTSNSGSTSTNTSTDTSTNSPITYNPQFGITQSQWTSLNQTQQAVIAAAYTAKQSSYNTDGQQLTFSAALQQASQDPTILSQYTDAANIDRNAFIQTVSSAQSSLTQTMNDDQRQFALDQKALSEKSAEAGQTFSGFRQQATNNLNQNEGSIVESTIRTAQDNLNNLGSSFESKYGSNALPSAFLSYTDPMFGQSNTLNYNKIGNLAGSQAASEQNDIFNKATSLYSIANTTPQLN